MPEKEETVANDVSNADHERAHWSLLDDPFADDDAPVGEDKEIILYYGEGRSYTDTTTEGDKNVDQNKRKASIPVRYDEWDADRCPLDGDTIYSTVGNNTEVGMVKDCEPDNNRTVVYWNLTRV